MAAIIAQITRANRERIDNKKYEVEACKSMYQIRPFDRCFDKLVGVAQCSKLREINCQCCQLCSFFCRNTTNIWLPKPQIWKMKKQKNSTTSLLKDWNNYVKKKLHQGDFHGGMNLKKVGNTDWNSDKKIFFSFAESSLANSCL